MKELWITYWKDWNWENWKNASKKNSQVTAYILCAPLLYAGFVGIVSHNSVQEIINGLFFILPTILVAVSILLHPIQPEIMFYLCPSEKEKRRSFLKKCYYFRMLLHMSILCAGHGILLFFAPNIPLKILPFLFVSDLCLSSVPALPENTWAGTETELIMDFNFMMDIWLWDSLFDEDIVTIVVFGICAAFEILLFLLLRKHIKKLLYDAGVYENENNNLTARNSCHL